MEKAIRYTFVVCSSIVLSVVLVACMTKNTLSPTVKSAETLEGDSIEMFDTSQTEYDYTAQGIPEHIYITMIEYLDSQMVSSAKASTYVRFFSANKEFLEQSFLEANTRFGTYTLQNMLIINEYLYDFTYYYELLSSEGEFLHSGIANNFVCELDGELFIVNNVREIPVELCDNLEYDMYIVEGDNVVNPDDVQRAPLTINGG